MNNKIFFILLFLVLLIQIIFPNFLKIFGVKPDLILIFVSLYIVYFDYKDAMTKCILIGLLKDSISVFPFGVSILTYAILLYFSFKLKKIFYQRHAMIFVVSVFVGCWINFIIANIYALFGISQYSLAYGIARVLIECFYSSVLSIATIIWLLKCATKKFTSLQSVFSY